MTLLRITVFVAGFVFIICFLQMVWGREQVRKDLHRRGFTAVSVRWRPFAYWVETGGIGFLAVFADATGNSQTSRCTVWFSQVRWIANEVEHLDKQLPLVGRLVYLIIALLLIIFGVKHLLTGELILPPSYKQIVPRPSYVHGWALVLLSSAAFCCSASLITTVMYCYHHNANERNYVFVARGFSVLGWILFWLSLGVHLYQFSHNPEQFYSPSR